MQNLDEILIKMSDEYNFNLLKKITPEDKESNWIYGEIISILIKKPNIQLNELIDEVNKGGIKFEKNKIRNRRDRIAGIPISIDDAIEIVNLLEDEEYEAAEIKLKTSNIVRDRMVLAILLEENFSEEFYDLYRMIKNDQCRGFLRALLSKLKESR